MADLTDKVRSSYLEVRRRYYFNYLLFAPIWLVRRLISILRIKRASENVFNSIAFNQLLFWTFWIDVRTAPVIRPPFGVSIMLIGQKAKDARIK
jgi:hypothetical protein